MGIVAGLLALGHAYTCATTAGRVDLFYFFKIFNRVGGL